MEVRVGGSSYQNYCLPRPRIVVLASPMEILSSYKDGAWRIMAAVPTKTASVKIQRNRRSRTIATYFQSSFTWEKEQTSFIHLNLNTYKWFNMLVRIRIYGYSVQRAVSQFYETFLTNRTRGKRWRNSKKVLNETWNILEVNVGPCGRKEAIKRESSNPFHEKKKRRAILISNGHMGNKCL